MERFETCFKAAVTAIGTILTHLYGGWSTLLGTVITVMIIDIITGVIAEALDGNLKADIMFRGVTKKIVMLVIISIGHLADSAIGTDMVMTATMFFYLASEFLSIIENSGRIGVPIPDIIKKAIKILEDKGDKDVE